MHSVQIAFAAVLLFSGSLAASDVPWSGPDSFLKARPQWPRGRAKERNLFVGFRAVVDTPAEKPVRLRLTASTLYRAWVNGRFLGYGPARGPHGYFRVDEWDITNLLRAGKNVVAVEVAGYNVNSYYTIDWPSFLQAEVTAAGDRVLAATGGNGSFTAHIIKERVRKTQRYSFQRPFSEVYRAAPGYDLWRSDPDSDPKPAECEELSLYKGLLPRRVPYPRFTLRPPLKHVSKGALKRGIKVKRFWKDRSLTAIGPKLGGYPEKELEMIPSLELQTVGTESREAVDRPVEPETVFPLKTNSFHILDMGTNLTGFIGASVRCKEKTRLFFTFDEVLRNDDVDFKRLGCVNIVAYELEPGSYRLESFEPYTFRYLKLMVLEGSCEVRNVYMREYTNPEVWEACFAASDPRLNRLFEAGRETYRQNAVDIFMDCPSRERAGWLCDSFFTSRTSKDLSGNTKVEKNFVENFLLPGKFLYLPEGMLPMCYPADHNDGVFIPNWALWFVVELEEYLQRSGDRSTVEALRPRVLRLFDYFKNFLNEDGLLEKLESWVFVEWSAANKFVQDVNYPSNMLYAAALSAAGRMYDRADLMVQAEEIRKVIRKQSFDGDFFVDNAVRKNGKLEVTRNRSEVCQYFAFFFDIATPKTYPELWRKLVEEFGPRRKETKAYPEVHIANAFIGNMLRLEILSRYGRCSQILDESVAYLMYMAEETGTLWENVGSYASCNHGFASHIVHTLYRDVLGLYRVDTVNRTIKLRFSDLDLSWCEGRLPTPDGPISLRWAKKDGKLTYRLDTPAGYRFTVENLSSLKLVRKP